MAEFDNKMNGKYAQLHTIFLINTFVIKTNI